MTEAVLEDFSIFLVEDNDDDVFLIRKAVSQANSRIQLHVANDGGALLEALESKSASGAALPSLIFLDINMPRMDGFEVTRALKADERFRHLPILMLTTTSRREDVRRAFECGASSFFTKPAEFDELVRLIEKVLSYWRQVTRLPSGG